MCANLYRQALVGVVSMKESSTYQAILEEGRTEGQAQGAIAEARKLLRLRAEDAFGPADARIIAAIERLNNLTQLEALFQRARTAGSWQQLFDQPAPNPRRGRRRPSP
jgi:predicted transposase YdaD